LSQPVLSVRDLRTHIWTKRGLIRAVEGVSFDIHAGEVLGLVGESGSGKSMTALSIMRLVPDPPGKTVGGQVLLDGRDLLHLSEAEMQALRGHRLAMVFQNPMSSLNPTMKLGRQIMEAMEVHLGISRARARERTIELFRIVGIPHAQRRLEQYPFEFSGGMRQRAMTAMALSCQPRLLIADEPTTALDVTIQAEIVGFVERLAREMNMAVLWITHDLGIVAGLCDRVAVMYAGQIIELSPRRVLFGQALHPYTLGLLGSVPSLEGQQSRRLTAIPGVPPDLARLPPGCPFYPRCTFHSERCLAEMPPLREHKSNHLAACWHVNDVLADRAPAANSQRGER
jgi:oligopeptide transport system ATP-binding protein